MRPGDLEAIATRVLTRGTQLRDAADAAHRQWERQMTLSNAIRRDDASRAAAVAGADDMVLLARAVLAQLVTDRAGS